MKSVQVEELRELMHKALALRGIEQEDADFIIADYMESELEGHPTHGISKFLTIDAGLEYREGSIEITSQAPCYVKINGHKELGHVAARRAAVMCMEMAKTQGIGIAAISNISRYSRVTPYARMMADAGLIGVVTNNGGPACVAPFGGRQPIFGTNPLCFGFPGEDHSFVFDFATAEKVWGAVRQAIVEDKPLPDRCFIDAGGAFTTDPNQAEAVIPFGGPKGSALCFALEILTGAFIGAKMGTEAQDEFDLGYLMVAASPEMFTDLATFKREIEKIASDVRACPPREGFQQVFVPGEIFGTTLVSARDRTEIEIPEDVYNRLRTMSTSLSGGYENNKKMN